MIIRSFVFFILALTVFKVFAVYLTSFSLFGDEAQYWLWSKNLNFGYLSKPPLIAWFIHLHTTIFGESFESLKLFPVFFYFITSFAIYDLCKKLNLEKSTSLICALSFLVTPAVTVSSFLLSTDVILLLFWTLSMNILINIRNNPSTNNFFILGIMLGLAFLAKYAAIYFFVSFLTLVLFDNRLRSILYLNKLKFALFLTVVFIVLLPNIIWNANNGWLTLTHTSDNANLENIDLSFLRGFLFFGIQILMVGPVLFIGMIFNIKKISYDFQNIFLLCFSAPIILIVFLESILVRANANWAAVALICLLVFLTRSLIHNKNIYHIINFIINFGFGFLFFLLIAISSTFGVFDRISGIREFSEELKAEMGGISNIVISDRLLYSNLSYEYKDEKYMLLMPLSQNKKISKHFQINYPLNKEMLDSFLFVGDPSEISYLKNNHKIKLLNEYRPKFTSSTLKIYEVTF